MLENTILNSETKNYLHFIKNYGIIGYRYKVFGIFLDNNLLKGEKNMAKKIFVRDLKVGYVLEDDIIHDGKILLKKGTVLTNSFLQRIRKWMSLDDCINISSDVISAENILATTSSKLINVAHKLYNENPDKWGRSLNEIQTYINEVSENVKIPGHEKLCYNFQDFSSKNEEINARHLFRTAKLSIALANVYNTTLAIDSEKIDLEEIGLAALLCSYGKSFESREADIKNLKRDEIFDKLNLPYNFLNKPFLKGMHSLYAYLALKDIVSEKCRRMILLSGLHNSFINKFDSESPAAKAAKLITLCYVYDKLLETVIMNNMTAPLENVLSSVSHWVSNGNLSKTAYYMFMDNILIYSPGTKVIITTGEYATVVGNNECFPTRPLVFTDNSLGAPRLLDLSESTTITVKSIVINKANSDSQINELEAQQMHNITV